VRDDAHESSEARAVRELYEAFNRRDYETATEMLHDDVELHQAEAIPDSDTWVGKDQFVRGLERWTSGFEPGFQYVIEEIFDAPNGVYMECCMHGRGRASGVDLAQPVYSVWDVLDGKPFRLRVFWRESEARRAAGLEH
jgi:ketosteroid isomerase-like protein